ncbi:MAG: HAD hydrolase-like protein [Alphaproteobacteria bacterium]|nr:HAD hydrolase-like protein [Alphaproteobacteria bacterium]
MNLNKPTIVIFDMDGTAVRHLNPRLLHICEFIDDISFKTGKFFGWIFRRGGKGPIVPRIEILENRKKPRRIVHRVIHKVRRKPVEQIVEPCPGIYAVLALLQKHNIPMSIVSSGLGKGYGHDILEKFELNKYYETTIFREDIKKSKPNPEPILMAMGRMKKEITNKDVIWYIGDRYKDVLAAQATNEHIKGTVIPIAYSLHAAMAIIEKGLNPDSIIMSYHDMYLFLENALEKP